MAKTNKVSLPLMLRKSAILIGQLGVRGVSVIFSSGDNGTGSACPINYGKNTIRFLPIFPAACPYVTSVGGTTGISPETAVGLSSGAFSDRWEHPWWQANAVNAYLNKLGDSWSGLYNPRGKGFPDVAAQAARYIIVNRNLTTRISGTSCAAPTFASW